MIILPVTGFFESPRIPKVTCAILILCALSLFVWQARDDEIEDRAFTYYVDSGLGKIESQRFSDHLKAKGLIEEHDPKATREEIIWDNLWKALRDSDYQRKLRNNQIISPSDPEFSEWRKKRTQFEALMNRSTTWRYSYKSAENEPITWLTHIFLHADFKHFFGNMLYFLVVAFVLEAGLGGPLFALAYLFGGLGSVFLETFFMPPSYLTSLGASGAISGIMATLVVLYGTRRIKFFYHLGFYFGTIAFPALAILPIWLAKELVFWSFRLGQSGGGTAYWAHLGGYAFGALFGLVVRATGLYNKELFIEREPDLTPMLLEKGLRHMGNLDHAKARDVFREVLSLKPDHLPTLKHLFALEKVDPRNSDFHQAANGLLAALSRAEPVDPSLLSYFREYRSLVTQSRLSQDVRVALAFWFADNALPEEAEGLAQGLMDEGSDPRFPSLILRLADSFDRAKRDQKARQWRKNLVGRYPESQESRMTLAKA